MAPYLTLAAYGAGLLLTLAAASVLTPASWWRRPNARALAIVVAGTWGVGALLAAATQPDMPKPIASYQQPARHYQVFRALNLRNADELGGALIP